MFYQSRFASLPHDYAMFAFRLIICARFILYCIPMPAMLRPNGEIARRKSEKIDENRTVDPRILFEKFISILFSLLKIRVCGIDKEFMAAKRDW